MNYNFIEIGTCNFDTCIETAGDNDYGISVEPIDFYLDQLPNKPLVKKINCAISKNNIEEYSEVYFVTEDKLIENNLPIWIKGCSSVGDYHVAHHNFKITHLVEKKLIKSIPIAKLFIDNQVTGCTLLKLDAEGSDSDILIHLMKFLETQDKSVYPKTIKFESNFTSVEQRVYEALYICINAGYRVKLFGYPCDTCELVLIE